MGKKCGKNNRNPTNNMQIVQEMEKKEKDRKQMEYKKKVPYVFKSS